MKIDPNTPTDPRPSIEAWMREHRPDLLDGGEAEALFSSHNNGLIGAASMSWYAGRAYQEKMHAPEEGSLWADNEVQFPRLLAEIRAVGLTVSQYEQLGDLMDLEMADIDELLERAEKVWQEHKEQHNRPVDSQ